MGMRRQELSGDELRQCGLSDESIFRSFRLNEFRFPARFQTDLINTIL